MSESPFASPAAEQAPETEAGSSSRRPLLIALGALGAAVLGAGAFFLLGGSDAAEQELAAPGAPAPAAVTPAPAASAAALPVASKVELGRNPFKALYVQPAATPASTAAPSTGGTTGGGTTGGGSTGGGTPTEGTAGGGSVPIVGVPQVPPTGTGGAPTAPAAKQELALVSATHVGEDHVAVFKIGGVQTTVKVGDTFGPSKHLLLLSLQQGPRDDQWTAVVQIGDGDPFDVVTGSPVLVQ